MENVLSLWNNSSNIELLSEYTILSDRSWRWLILLFMVRECSIQINGQLLNWDSINTLNNILHFSRVIYPAIRPNALSFRLLYLIFKEITLSQLLKRFAIKSKVITFKNVESNLECCSTFISWIEIVGQKKHKFPLILLPFVLFNNQTSAKSV